MSRRGVGLFFRPNNLTMTTLLQSLSIIKQLAQKSGNEVTFFQSPRAETQSMLNYGGIRVKDSRKADSLVNQAHRISMSSRAVLDSATLEHGMAQGGERGVGLKEVADLIGLRLGSGFPSPSQGSEEETMDMKVGGKTEKDEREHIVEVKVERRHSEARVRRDRFTNVDPYKQAHIDVLFHEFGGFSQQRVDETKGRREKK